MANLDRNTDGWSKSVTLSKQSMTAVMSTAGKYIDKDISLAVSAQDGAGAISGGGLTHGEITTTDTTYLTGTSTSDGYAVTVSNIASRAAISAPISTAGWIDNGDIAGVSATGNDTKSKTFYVKKGSASVTAGQSITTSGSITRNGSTLTATLSGSKTINGSATAGWVTSVSGASVSASGTATANVSDLEPNLTAANIVKGATVFGITGTGGNNKAVTFSNAATANGDGTSQTYTDVTENAPVLVAGDYLYVNEGYTGNVKMSLAKLVPDGTTITTNTTSNLIYKTVTARNDDGKLVTGTMDDATVKSGAPSVSGTPSVGAQNSSTKKYPLTATISVAAPSVTAGGYITSAVGTKSTNSGSVTINLDPAECTVAGGGLTAGAGSSSINVNGYYDGTNVSTTDKIDITSQTTAAAGYYKIGTTGKGTVNRAAITDAHTAGWLPAKSAANVSDATSLSSNSGTSTYYVKKSTTGTAASFTPGSGQTYNFTPSGSNAQKLTISAGYYPSDRTITVSKIDPSSASQVTAGAVSTNDSAISTVSATVGTATIDTSKYKYNIPLSLSASGTAYAKVTTNGYLTDAANTSKSLSKTGSATVTLDLYDGTYSWA